MPETFTQPPAPDSSLKPEGGKLRSSLEILEERTQEVLAQNPDLDEDTAFAQAYQQRRSEMHTPASEKVSDEEWAAAREEGVARGLEQRARIEALVEGGMSPEGAMHQTIFENELRKWREAATEHYIQSGVEPAQAVKDAHTVAEAIHGSYDKNIDTIHKEFTAPGEIIKNGIKELEAEAEANTQPPEPEKKLSSRELFLKQFKDMGDRGVEFFGKPFKLAGEMIGGLRDRVNLLGPYYALQLAERRYMVRDEVSESKEEFDARCLRRGKLVAAFGPLSMGALVSVQGYDALMERTKSFAETVADQRK